YPLVFLGRALVDYDAFVYFYPQRVFLARSLLSGQVPLWDPYLFLGVPFLANPQTAVLYPPSWLFVLGPVQSVYAAQLVLHSFLAAFFTYLLARRAFGVLPLAAAIGGLGYAFGGFAVGQVGHLNQISAAAWLPAVLLAYDRFAVTRRVYWLALGALALGMQLLAGHPQESYMSLIVLGIFGVVGAPWRSARRLAVCALGGAFICVLGADLAAAQLLPTLELTPLSIRGAGVSWPDAVAGSLPAYLSIRALLPPFWVQVASTEYLGYVGVIPIVLGVIALVFGRSRPVFLGVLICFLGLFLALGENNVFYSAVFSAVPGFDTFRVPARWLLVWQFGAALLAALGADWIGHGARVPLRRPQFWARAVAVAFILVIALAWQRDNGEPYPQRRTPFVLAGLAAVTLAVGALPHLGQPILALGMLVGMTGAELWAVPQASPARQAPPPAFTQGESVDWLRAHGVTDQERLLSLARPEYVPASENALRAALGGLPETMVQSLVIAQKWNDTLAPNLPLQFGLNSADGYDGGVLPLLRWVSISKLLVPAPRTDGVLLSRLEDLPTDRLLDLLGVRYIIVNPSQWDRPGIQTADFGDLKMFVRPDPVPRSLVVFGATIADTDAAALERMGQSTFDSNREVVLGPESSAVSRPSVDGPMPVQPDVALAERWHARVSLAQPGYLLQREAWYPGWKARVDGVDTPVVRADVLFRAVPLSPGTHDVEVYFEGATFNRGLLLSLAGVLVAAVLLVWRWLPGWRRRDHGYR
ncbi:MAG: YfhO family protein, partial [Chloroflexota bacterium]|nr:YfhO family protein [Chloroflexota bacterium]